MTQRPYRNISAFIAPVWICGVQREAGSVLGSPVSKIYLSQKTGGDQEATGDLTQAEISAGHLLTACRFLLSEEDLRRTGSVSPSPPTAPKPASAQEKSIASVQASALSFSSSCLLFFISHHAVDQCLILVFFFHLQFELLVGLSI